MTRVESSWRHIWPTEHGRCQALDFTNLKPFCDEEAWFVVTSGHQKNFRCYDHCRHLISAQEVGG